VRRILYLLLGIALPAAAAAQERIPLPKPRPKLAEWQLVSKPIFVAADVMSELSACVVRLQNTAQIEPIVLLNGSQDCGGDDMVRLKSITMPDKSRVELSNPPQVRCPMAEELTKWVREDFPSVFSASPLRTMINYDTYECRPRNRIMGAKLSEHSKGNALDIRAFKLADGQVIDPTDVKVERGLREKIKALACGRFSTVLGPGSDGHHESHIHVDIAERGMRYALCRWVVRDPPKPSNRPHTKPDYEDVLAAADVPLPPVRPRGASLGNTNSRL